jgi:hypothetical protein
MGNSRKGISRRAAFTDIVVTAFLQITVIAPSPSLIHFLRGTTAQ